MQRAMARQAEAERERRAKIINAEGEFQAAEKLAERRRDPRPRAVGAAAALPADAARDRRRPELDDRVPAAARPAQAVPDAQRAARSANGGAPLTWTVDAHPLPARGRARVLRRRPAHARGRGRPRAAPPRATRTRCARVARPLRHRQRGRARGPDRHRRRDGVALLAWDDPTLHAKLALLVLVFVLAGLHVVDAPQPRDLARHARHLARDRLARGQAHVRVNADPEPCALARGGAPGRIETMS